MSKWFTAEVSDMEIDRETSTVDIVVCSDDDGNIWLSIPFKLIKEFAEKIDAPR